MNHRTAQRILRNPKASEWRRVRANEILAKHISHRAHTFYTKNVARAVSTTHLVRCRHVPDVQRRVIFY